MGLNRFNANDDFATMISFFDMLSTPVHSLPSFKGRFVDESEYDIIPKRSKIEKDIKAKEAEISRMEQFKKDDMQFYDSRIKSLKLELDQLKQKLSP